MLTMSLEDLERAGLLLPRKEWGKRNLQSTVNKPLLAACGLLAIVSTVLMYWGDGGSYTWIGAGLFLAAFFGFTLLSTRAIEKQCRTSSSKDEPGRE